MNTLNTFLRKLPELVVDNIQFVRNVNHSEYHVDNGIYRFHKIDYNSYSVKNLSNPRHLGGAQWGSSEGSGDIFITGLHLTLVGVKIVLGEDVPDSEYD